MEPGTIVEYVNGSDDPDVPPDNHDRGMVIADAGKFIKIHWDLWGEIIVNKKHVRTVG